MESDAPARALSSTERKKRQLYNPGTATWTDDKPASPGGRRALWEALAGPAPPPPPAEPEPEDSGLKFTNATPAAELLAPVFTALQVASLCPGASLDDAADFLSSQHGLVTVGQIREAIGHGESVRPLHSLGRSLLKSSRLGYAQPFLQRLSSLVEQECAAQAQAEVAPQEATASASASASAAAAAADASPAGKPPTLAAAPPGKALTPREAAPGQLLRHAEGPTQGAAVLALAAGGGYVFSGGCDGEVIAWRRSDLGFAAVLHKGAPSGQSARALCVAAAHLFCGGESQELHCWSLASLKPGPALPALHTQAVTALAAVPRTPLAERRGERRGSPAAASVGLFTASLDGAIRGWDLTADPAQDLTDGVAGGGAAGGGLRGGEPVGPLLGHTGPVVCLAAAAEAAEDASALLGLLQPKGRRTFGRVLYSGGADKTVRVWDPMRRCQLRVLNQPAFTVGVSAVAPVPAGGTAAGGGVLSGSHDLRLWRGGALLRALRMRQHPGKIVSLACADGGTHCYSGGDGGAIRAFALPALDAIGAMQAGGAVRALLLDGDVLFSGSADGKLSAWAGFAAATAAAAAAPAAYSRGASSALPSRRPATAPAQGARLTDPDGRPVPPPGWRQGR